MSEALLWGAHAVGGGAITEVQVWCPVVQKGASRKTDLGGSLAPGTIPKTAFLKLLERPVGRRMAKPISFVVRQFLNAGRMTDERKSGMSLDLPAAKAQSYPSSCFSTTLTTSDYADNTKTHGGSRFH